MDASKLTTLLTSGTAKDIAEYIANAEKAHKAKMKELRCLQRIREADENDQ